jgi:hypothetical protein
LYLLLFSHYLVHTCQLSSPLLIKALLDQILQILNSNIPNKAASTEVKIIINRLFRNFFGYKALKCRELLLNDAVKIKFHRVDELSLVLLVEDVDAVGQLPPDRADELRHPRVLLLLEGLVLPEGVGLQEQGSHAQGEGGAVGVNGVDDLLVS